MLAAGVVLLLSPLLRYVFYNGFCFDGAWSPAADIPRYSLPEFCEQGLLWAFSQEIWVGPLRDVTLPVFGAGLIVLAWVDTRKAESEVDASVENDKDDGQSKAPWYIRAKPERWMIFALAVMVWAGGSYLNFRSEQERLAQEIAEESEAREKQRAALEAEMQKVAADKAARRVHLAWLQGSWAPLDGLDEDKRSSKDQYCATDTGIQFKAGGKYVSYEEDGDFRLTENEILFTNRRHVGWYDPQVAPVSLEPSTREVERNGDQLIVEGDPFGRC